MLDLFFNARGILARQPFILGWLFLLAVELAFLFGIIGASAGSPAQNAWFSAGMVASGVSTVAVIVLCVKRLRFVNITPWAAAFALVPGLSLVLLIVLSLRITEAERHET
jgi:uncharacterized membrane protein YhaH (DUF805 family)